METRQGSDLIDRAIKEKHFRTIEIRASDIDEEKRTVSLSFSSEEPYERYWGVEVLDHGAKSVIMDRLNNGAPFLVNHDTRDQVGVVEKAVIGSDRKGRASVRFGRSNRAEEILQDVIDGIRKNVSVGYRIHEMVLEKEEEDKRTYRVTSWEPFEVSIVPIPADNSVGVGRSDEEAKQNSREEKKQMEKEVSTTETTATAQAPKTEVRAAQNEVDPAVIAERELGRMRDIATLGGRFNMRKEADEYIGKGRSVAEFQALVLERVAAENNKPITVDDPEIGLSKSDKKRYSIFNVLRALAFKDNQVFHKAAAFELEVSRAAAQKLNLEPQGILMPYDIYASREVPYFPQKRTLSAGTVTDGAELVATNLLAGSFIDVLRNLAVVMSMGARPLAGLVGNVAIPRKTSGSTAGWITPEGSNAALSEPQFDQVMLSPKTLGAYSEITRQLLLQSSLDVENLVRMDLATAVALAIDIAALYGTGATGQPRGVRNQTGINMPTAFAGAVPTYAEVVAMESAVAVDNALLGNLGYLIEPSMRGSFKTSEKFSNTGQTIWEPGNTVNGYKSGVTNQITGGDVFFGNWADLLIGFWGALDILIDPYTNSLSGTLRIVVHQSCDAAVRHPVSFAFNNDGA